MLYLCVYHSYVIYICKIFGKTFEIKTQISNPLDRNSDLLFIILVNKTQTSFRFIFCPLKILESILMTSRMKLKIGLGLLFPIGLWTTNENFKWFHAKNKEESPFYVAFFEPMNPNAFWFDFGPFEQRFSKLIWGFYLASPFDQKPKDLVEFDVVKKEKSNLNDAICSYKNHCFFVSESAQIEQGSYKIALWVFFTPLIDQKPSCFVQFDAV